MGKTMCSIIRILVLLVLAVFFSFMVSAEDYFLIYVEVQGVQANVSRFDIIEFNSATADIAPEGDYQDFDDFEVVLLGSSGDEIDSVSVHQGDNLVDYVEGVSGLRLLRGGIELMSSDVSFCDNDGYCEPCMSGFCELAENAVSCGDCAKASFDNFCDPQDDGLCDDDCFTVDPDCAELYGVEEPISSEYIETQIELQNQPGMTITPSGVRASTVLEAGIDDYCYVNLRGDICGLDEYCSGDEFEYYYQTYCCMGRCVYEFGYDFEEQGALPLYAEEVEFANDMVEFEEVPVVVMDNETGLDDVYEDFELMEGADSYRLELEESMSDEVIAQDDEDGMGLTDSIAENIPDAVKGLNLPVVIGSLLVLFLIIFGLLAVFRKSADKIVDSSSEATGLQQGPVVPVDLQSEIDMLLSKGFGYAQIRVYLVNKGHSQADVDSGIRKNYELRKSRQGVMR